MAAGLADIETRLHDIRRSIDSYVRRLGEARQHLKQSERAWRDQADQSSAQSRDEAARDLARVKKSIEASASEARSQAGRIIASVVGRSAPGYLSNDWTDISWNVLAGPAPGNWVRVGSLNTPPATVPIALPLSAGVWRVQTPGPEAFRSVIHNAIMRLIAAFDAPRVRTMAFDPNLSLDLGAFAAVRSVHQQSVPPPMTSIEDFERELGSLVADLAATHDRLVASGYDSYWSALDAGDATAMTAPLRLLVIAAAPLGISDRGAARLAQARRLAADLGLLVIEASDPGSDTPDQGLTITLAGESASTSAIPGLTWTADAWVGDQAIRAFCAALVDRPRTSLAPTVDFESIVDCIDDAWMSDADEGLEATIGIVDGGDLVVHLRSENPPMPNALIGGAVGQGKSNLLLVLIHALAARYSPAELEMILIDLRDGVEFARFMPSRADGTWLPHVRALGLEFDPDYSLAVLKWVSDQMPRRSGQLGEASSTSLKEYHAATGKPIPRLVVVIDEFQKLFEGDDDQVAQAASLLENIARTGRGFGIHLILASQAVTGIRGLAVKQDAIFGQFHNRISLKNTAAESQAFLATHNLAATELEHRGQVVVNDALGAPDHNRFGTVAYADETYLARLRAHLFAQGHGAAPEVFRSSAFAVWTSAFSKNEAASGVAPAVGLPIGIDPAPRRLPWTPAPNQALAVVGSDRACAIAVLSRAVVTAATAIGAAARVTLLDGDSLGGAEKPWITALITHLERAGAVVERVERVAIASRLNDLAASMGHTDLLVPIALDSVDLGTPVEPDYIMPNESLRTLLKNGPLSGIWTIGWWQSKAVLDEHLGYRAPGVRAWAFCGVSRDDLTDICGHGVRQPATQPRFIWFDRTGGGSAERLVPFGTTDILGEVSLD